jgi:hypothetical protein
MNKENLPDYKLANASLGIYDATTKSSYLNTVEAFRTEFYRIKGAIESATTKAEMDAVIASVNFPTELVAGE